MRAAAPLVLHLAGAVEVFSHRHVITHRAFIPARAFHEPENITSEMELWPETRAAHTSSFLSARQICPEWMQIGLQL